MKPRTWRLPPIETYPRAVAVVQTVWGKLLLLAVFALVLKTLVNLSLQMTVSAALVAMAGRHRMKVALAAAVALLLREPYWYGYGELDEAILIQAGLGDRVSNEILRGSTWLLCAPVAFLALILARRFRSHAIGKRVVLLQHAVCLGLIGFASSHILTGMPQALLWSVTLTLTAYFWYLAYALVGQSRKNPPSLVAHFATFHPFFAPHTMVPFGKGALDWLNVEAKDTDALARTQLKGLKLLVWAFLLRTLQWGLQRVIYVGLGVPPLNGAFREFLDSGQAPALSFASLVFNFPDQLLSMAVMGHAFIATARLAGFGMLRNTYRPLSSRSIAEFWNRYFFYFKELMVHIYFYPTYLRWFKSYPRLRMAFATFMAAGVGNFFFHFLQEEKTLVARGPWETALGMETYVFYCVVLVAGIVISQLRGHRIDPSAGWWRRQFFPSLWVAIFYGFLSFFDSTRVLVDLDQHFGFLSQVVGIEPWIRAIG